MAGLTSGEIMDEAALLLNDFEKRTFTYAIQLPWLKRAINNLSDELAVNSITLLNKASVILPTTGDILRLPSDALLPVLLEERKEGSTEQWVEMTHVDRIPDDLIPGNVLNVWSFEGTLYNSAPVLKLPPVTTDREVRVTYERFLPYTNLTGGSDDLGTSLVWQSKTFLSSRIAENISKFVLRADKRAAELRVESEKSLYKLVQIWIKFKQETPVRKAGYRRSYPELRPFPYILASESSGDTEVTNFFDWIVVTDSPYNAVPDDNTLGADNLVAIQAAIDAATTLGNKRIYFPPGDYYLTGQLSMVHAHGIQFWGENRDTTRLIWSDDATKGLVINTTSPSPVSSLFTANGNIGDRSIDVANGGNFSEGVWAYMEDNQTRGGSLLTKVRSVSSNTVTLDDALPVNLLLASSATLYSYQTYPLIKGLLIQGLSFVTDATNPTNKLTLLQINRADRAIIKDCAFEGSTGPLITTVTCYANIFQSCTFKKAYTVAGTGIELQASTGCTVVSCSFDLCQFGITFAASPYGRSLGNTINGRATSVALGRGIKYQDQSNFGIIAGNNISDTNLFSIYLQDSAFCSVQGNTCSFTGSAVNTGQHGIQVGGFEDDFCQHNSITGNIIRGASGYGIVIGPTSAVAVDNYAVITGNNISDCLWGAIALVSGASYVTITGNFCNGSASTIGGVIRATDGSINNTITGNVITATGATPPAIITSGGGGGTLVSANVVDALVITQHADDKLWATIDDLNDTFPLEGIYTNTGVSTGANTTETTAWTIPVPAGKISATNQGFNCRAHFSLADNTNTKTLRFKLGASSFDGLSAVAGGFAVLMIAEAYYLTNTTAFVFVHWIPQIVTAGGAMMGGTHANVTGLDFAAGFNITITIQNGTASAGDISFRGGKFDFQGVRTSA